MNEFYIALAALLAACAVVLGILLKNCVLLRRSGKKINRLDLSGFELVFADDFNGTGLDTAV